jgi:hypothetical protein
MVGDVMVFTVDERHRNRFIRQGSRRLQTAEPAADDDDSGALQSFFP